MRRGARHPSFSPFVLLVTVGLIFPGCEKTDTMTGPSVVAAPASIDGTWSGKYVSYDPAGCGSSPATAVFRQDGAIVTGTVSTSTCGVTGYFKGRVEGNLLTGAIAMAGCVGGGASGTVSGSELVLSIGDLTKPLVAGDKTIMYGGLITFHR